MDKGSHLAFTPRAYVLFGRKANKVEDGGKTNACVVAEYAHSIRQTKDTVNY